MSGAGNLALRIAEALKQRYTHQVMPSVALEAGERHLWSAAATSRLPSPERTKTSTMPTDNWTCLEKVESFPWMKGELDDEAEGIYARA
jgi:hypothetical protein